MKKKKYIKIPKNFYKSLKFKVKTPDIGEPWCAECRKNLEEYINSLIPVTRGSRS